MAPNAVLERGSNQRNATRSDAKTEARIYAKVVLPDTMHSS